MTFTSKQEIKIQLILEQLAIFALSIYIFSQTGTVWYIFPLFFLLPDLSALGYLLNPQIGARVYNVFHSQFLAVSVIGIGLYTNDFTIITAGSILLGHSSLDRVFGYGLKYPDSFKHTHLD